MSEEIEQIDASKAVAIFTGGLDEILDKIARDLRDFKPDISTEKGRKEIASQAYKAARCKTKLDEMGKDLNEEAQRHIDAVNADRKKAVKFLDALRDEIRKPLDDWQDAENKRIKDHEEAIVCLSEFRLIGGMTPLKDINKRMHDLDDFWKSRDWQEFAMRAENTAKDSFDILKTALAEAKKYEAEQAELETLRAEKIKRDAEEAERKRIEYEAKIAQDAADKARKDAEEEAQRKAKEAADKAAADLEKAKQAELEAERRAGEAILAVQQAESNAKAAAEQAEKDRILAEEKAKRDQDAAIEAERKRVADIQALEDEAKRKREENLKHRAKINNEALKAFAELDCVLGEVPAKAIVIAIAEGKIPHVKITY